MVSLLLFVLMSLLSAAGALNGIRCVSRDEFLCTSFLVASSLNPNDNLISTPSSQHFLETHVIPRDLVCEKQLGKGSFKTVHRVSSPDTGEKYALAVERLKGKRDSREALQGIRIAQKLNQQHRSLSNSEDDDQIFEQVLTWWVQSTSPNMSPGQPVVVPTSIEDSQKIPSRFLGSIWLLSLKPLYDMDLKRFAQASPSLYPCGNKISSKTTSPAVVAGIYLTDEGALGLARDLCHIGLAMQRAGLVHRDIKPKNLMLSGGHPVVIDFGFSGFVEIPNNTGRRCIIEPGRIKGELAYVLAKDAAEYRGCQEGDQYAMAKTIYEVIFGDASPPERSSGRQTISESSAYEQNEAFLKLISTEESFGKSRFILSHPATKTLMTVIRGLSNPNKGLSFADAENIFNKALLPVSQNGEHTI